MCPAPHSAQPGRTVGPTQGASRGQSTESETVSCSRFTGTDVAMAKPCPRPAHSTSRISKASCHKDLQPGRGGARLRKAINSVNQTC